MPRSPEAQADIRPTYWDRLAWAYALPFGIAALYGLFLKYLVLAKPSGYLALSRYLARAGARDFTWSEHLALYSEDLLVAVVLIPGVAVTVLSLLPRRWRPLAAAAALLLLVVAYYASMLSVGNAGVLLDRRVAIDAVQWAWRHPGAVNDYASWSSLGKLGAVVLAVASLTWFAWRVDVRPLGGAEKVARVVGRAYRIWGAIAVLVWAGTLSMPIRALAPSTSATRSAVVRLLESDDATGAYARMQAGELTADFARLAGMPSNGSDVGFGVAAGHSVVLFVLETATTVAFDIDAELSPGGALTQLADRALTSKRHHSTYPYTSDAIFSILSSLYPTGRRSALERVGEGVTAGWVGALGRRGYVTAQYAPTADTFEDDSKMYSALGFQRRYVAANDPAIPDAVAGEVQDEMSRYRHLVGKERSDAESAIRHDLMAWHRLRADIADWSTKDIPFVVMFAPQIGHGPWLNLADSPDFDLRGRDIARLQMKWLSGLVQQLRDSGALERTIIVVTADHGPRTRAEYPSLVHGAITGVSMRVPLLVYSQAAFAHRVELEQPTSHVDIGPTLMHYLGVRDWQALSAGVPFGHATAGRKVFFFGRGYLGADGFLDNAGYHSCEYMLFSCVRDADMRFDSRVVTTESRAEAQNDIELLSRISQLQIRATALAFGASDSLR